MSSETVVLTIYDLAPIEVSVESAHSMFKFFELLIVDVNLKTLPMANESV